ncbi:MAG: FkbM family methyltransferase [Devosia sp.]
MRANESKFGMWWRWQLYRRWRNERGRKSMYDFRSYIAQLPAGALAIDCGANVGDVTAALLKEGLRVIAFEPDPICLAQLHRRFAGDERVTIVPKAVGASSRRMPLYRQVTRGRPVTEASSFLRMKHHRPEPAGEIEVIDLVEFARTLGEPICLLKLDIEGAEAEVLEALLDSGVHRSIQRIFVETHERLDPALAVRIGAIRGRVSGPDFAHIDLDWQ